MAKITLTYVKSPFKYGDGDYWRADMITDTGCVSATGSSPKEALGKLVLVNSELFDVHVEWAE